MSSRPMNMACSDGTRAFKPFPTDPPPPSDTNGITGSVLAAAAQIGDATAHAQDILARLRGARPEKGVSSTGPGLPPLGESCAWLARDAQGLVDLLLEIKGQIG